MDEEVGWKIARKMAKEYEERGKTLYMMLGILTYTNCEMKEKGIEMYESDIPDLMEKLRDVNKQFEHWFKEYAQMRYGLTDEAEILELMQKEIFQD